MRTWQGPGRRGALSRELGEKQQGQNTVLQYSLGPQRTLWASIPIIQKKKKKANRNVAFQSSTNSKITINQNFSVDSHYRLSHPQKVHTQHINECFKE